MLRDWLEEIRNILQNLPSRGDEIVNSARRAAVALVLRENSSGEPEILFIERAEREDDPWSGQMAFPGGRVDEGETDLQAAVRETSEEVGLHLTFGDYLGHFQEVQGRKGGKMLPFYISPHVFYYTGDENFRLDLDEVAEAMWIPLRHLMDARNFRHFEFKRDGVEVRLPGIQFPRKILWGLTYMHLSNFFTLVRETSIVRELQREIDPSREPFWFWEKYP
jgi:8-oxo-dGTP pyrophosphatase MutT (NUDIX family)